LAFAKFNAGEIVDCAHRSPHSFFLIEAGTA
jgi:hypothetical protein